MTLSWAAPASDGGGAITEYEYRYSTGTMVSSSASWTDVADGSDMGDSTADETSVTISSLVNGTQYAFEVRAVNSVGDGTAAGPVTATPVDTTAQAGVLVSTIGQSDISFSTVGSTDNAVQFSTGSNPATLSSIEIKLQTATDTGTPTAKVFTGSLSGSTLTLGTEVATLAGPASLTANTTANYTYTAPANTSLSASTDYYLLLELASGSVKARLADTGGSVDSGGATGWAVPNKNYDRTKDSTGTLEGQDGVFLFRVNGTEGTATVTVPGAPTSFMATAGDAAVTLSWAAPASDGGGAITEYEYRYSTGSTVMPSATWTDVTDGSDSGTSTADETGVTVSGLTNGTEYAFEVRAVNSAGGGTAASAKTATPAAASCTAPSFGTRRNIWTGTVTVGTEASARGFLGGSPVVGALDDKTFSIGSSNHEIDALWVYTVAILEGDVVLSLKDAALTTAEKAALRLHVCNTTSLDFSAASLSGTGYSYTWADDLDWTSLSSRTLYLSLPPNNAATGAPEISGTVAVGHTLMAAKGTIADADGVPTTFTYQWLRVDGANETDITGATESSYTVTADDIGKTLKVKLGFTDNLSGEEARTSAATATVAQPPTVSIAAVHTDVLMRVANPEFRVTISAAQTLAVTVNLSIAQAASYLTSTTQSIEIQANQTSATKKFSSFYSGTTSGDLTATVAAGRGYVPAAPPASAATVTVLAPANATILSYYWAEAAYSVTEGDSLDVVVMLRTAAGVPKPRESFNVSAILTEELTGEPDKAILDVDYTHTSETGGLFAPDEWTADGAVFTATRTYTVPTIEDSAYEGNERFRILLTAAAGGIGSKGTPGETIVTIVDDEALKVTGVAVSSTPSGSSTYGAGETISFTATFSAKVTVTGTPQLPFSLGGVTKQAAYASGSDSAALVFSYTVVAGDNDADGVSWRADALSLNGGTIKFMTSVVANQVDAALTHAAKTAQSDHKVDTPPVLSTPTVNVTVLVLTYNEALDTGSEPASSAFTVKVGGTAVSLASSGAVAVSGRTVTLTPGRGGDGGG